MKQSFLSLLLMVPVIAGAVDLNAEDGCYHIADYEQLKEFATIVNNGSNGSKTACGVLDADIVANEIEFNPNSGEPTNADELDSWTPLKDFNGTFDGNNKTISGLYCVTTDDTTGFIRTTSGSGTVIQNLGIKNSYFKANGYVGVFVGAVYGSLQIKNSFNQSNVLAGTAMGGFIGIVKQNANVTIDASYNVGTVGLGFLSWKYIVGGFIGSAESASLLITNSFNAGNVIGNQSVGGFVGICSGHGSAVSIKNSYSIGSVNGSRNVGAFVGESGYSNIPLTIVNSYYLDDGIGAVNGNSFTGATSVSSEAFTDGTVYKALHDYTETDEESGEVIFDGSVWQKGEYGPTINPNGGSSEPEPEAFIGVTFGNIPSSSSVYASFEDGEELVYIPRDTTVGRVDFYRDFKKDVMATVIFPFESVLNPNKAVLLNFKGIHKDSVWKAHFTASVDGRFYANVPYLILPVDDFYGMSFYDDIKLVSNKDTIYEQDEGAWTMKGTYKAIKWAEEDYATPHIFGFAASAKEGFYKAGQFVKAKFGASITSMRVFLDYKAPMNRPGLFKSASFALPETIDIVIDDENGENSMTIGKLNTVTGEVKSDRWFDMKGRKLNAKPTFNGIFQNNGRQVIVK